MGLFIPAFSASSVDWLHPNLSQRFDLSLEGEQVLTASTEMGPQVLGPRNYPQCVKALRNSSKTGTCARSHSVSTSQFPQPRPASQPRCCHTIRKATGTLLHRSSFFLEGIHHDSWEALSCNAGEVCFSFCLCGIFGGVIGLIGCFSFGFFMLVLYFIWQWGLTALLEIEFIFSTALMCL